MSPACGGRGCAPPCPLQNFSFICLLSYDVYIKKMIIESVIDNINSQNSKTNKKENSKKESSKKDTV